MQGTVERLQATTACYRLSDIVSDMDAATHPNKQMFKGTLLLLDTPSDQSPFGAEGHKIMVPSTVAADKLSGLVGMGLNYEPKEMKSHAPRNKVGVIDKAWIEGAAVKVSGWVWKKDYPEAASALKGKSLGMSMELANVMVRDKDEDTWYLEDFSFTGATALWPQSAAYHKTSLAAAKAQGEKGRTMPDKKKKKPTSSAGILAAAIGNAVSTAIAPLAAEMQENRKALETINASLQSRQPVEEVVDDDQSDNDVAAAGDDSPEVTAALDELSAAFPDNFKKKKKDEEEDESDMEAGDESATDEEESEDDDESEMDAGLENTAKPIVENKPGSLNKEKKQMGNKTTVSAQRQQKVTRVAAAADNSRVVETLNAATEMINTMRAQQVKDQKTIRKQASRIDAMQAQLERYATQVERRTLTPELTAIMNKSGYSTSTLMAEGRKLRVDEVNAMLDRCGIPLEPQTRIGFKMELEQRGLMEDGVIDRRNIH